ncbi:phenazine biosynthesis [Fusarium sp. NRRL 25303]|nr:phenazine biosynthesis [Fusarium sp. NRRL 25303]
MAASKAPYITLDVFTLTRFKGNPLAVVGVEGEALSYGHMLTIAREFNYSETVFIRQSQDGELSINIFTPAGEIDFAGHPVIGTGYMLFHQLLPGISLPDPIPETISVSANAGPILLRHNYETGTVLAEVPHNVHIQSSGTPKQNILDTQPNLVDQASRLSQEYPAVSIVKGVTYTLVDMSDQEDLFIRVAAGKSPVTELDDGWAPSFTGTMYYRRGVVSLDNGVRVENLRVRMIGIGLEDPATGSACCSLAAYLALQQQEPNGTYRFCMEQGREMGRKSDIIVDVILDGSGNTVLSMFLSGLATLVAEGTIRLP